MGHSRVGAAIYIKTYSKSKSFTLKNLPLFNLSIPFFIGAIEDSISMFFLVTSKILNIPTS